MAGQGKPPTTTTAEKPPTKEEVVALRARLELLETGNRPYRSFEYGEVRQKNEVMKAELKKLRKELKERDGAWPNNWSVERGLRSARDSGYSTYGFAKNAGKYGYDAVRGVARENALLKAKEGRVQRESVRSLGFLEDVSISALDEISDAEAAAYLSLTEPSSGLSAFAMSLDTVALPIVALVSLVLAYSISEDSSTWYPAVRNEVIYTMAVRLAIFYSVVVLVMMLCSFVAGRLLSSGSVSGVIVGMVFAMLALWAFLSLANVVVTAFLQASGVFLQREGVPVAHSFRGDNWFDELVDMRRVRSFAGRDAKFSSGRDMKTVGAGQEPRESFFGKVVFFVESLLRDKEKEDESFFSTETLWNGGLMLGALIVTGVLNAGSATAVVATLGKMVVAVGSVAGTAASGAAGVASTAASSGGSTVAAGVALEVLRGLLASPAATEVKTEPGSIKSEFGRGQPPLAPVPTTIGEVFGAASEWTKVIGVLSFVLLSSGSTYFFSLQTFGKSYLQSGVNTLLILTGISAADASYQWAMDFALPREPRFKSQSTTEVKRVNRFLHGSRDGVAEFREGGICSPEAYSLLVEHVLGNPGPLERELDLLARAKAASDAEFAKTYWESVKSLFFDQDQKKRKKMFTSSDQRVNSMLTTGLERFLSDKSDAERAEFKALYDRSLQNLREEVFGRTFRFGNLDLEAMKVMGMKVDHLVVRDEQVRAGLLPGAPLGPQDLQDAFGRLDPERGAVVRGSVAKVRSHVCGAQESGPCCADGVTTISLSLYRLDTSVDGEDTFKFVKNKATNLF